jgi:hypothetical protein
MHILLGRVQALSTIDLISAVLSCFYLLSNPLLTLLSLCWPLFFGLLTISRFRFLLFVTRPLFLFLEFRCCAFP